MYIHILVWSWEFRNLHFYMYHVRVFTFRCNHWKQRDTPEGVYRDWFDASKFKEHKEWITDASFDLSLCITLNVDWWQPFEKTIYSMGGVYSSVLNLPRDIRQKLDNIFTLGEKCQNIGTKL